MPMENIILLLHPRVFTEKPMRLHGQLPEVSFFLWGQWTPHRLKVWWWMAPFKAEETWDAT